MTYIFSLFISAFFYIFDIFATYRLLSNKLIYRFNSKTIFPIHILAYAIMFTSAIIGDFVTEVPLKLPLMLLLYTLYACMYKGAIYIRVLWIVVSCFLMTVSELIAIPVVLFCTNTPFNELLNNPVTYCTGLALSRLLELISVELILLFSQKRNNILKSLVKEIFVILLIDVAYSILIVSLFYYDNIYLDVHTAIGLSVMVLFLISLISIFLLYKVLKKSQDMMDTNLKLQQAELSLQLNQDMASIVDDLRSLRHDMNNHMSILQGLVSMKEYDEVNSYLNSITKELNVANNYLFIDNNVLSVLINSKMTKAMQLGITLETEILSSSTPLSDRDLCSLVGNILENAIEAASKHSNPYIHFSMKKTGDTYQISCDNTYTIKPIRNGIHFVSTKANAEYHGIGTKNILSIAHDYKGNVDFLVDEQFHVLVTLPI